MATCGFRLNLPASFIKNILTSHTKSFHTSRWFSSGNLQWDLLSALCIERKPILSKELNGIEKEFVELCDVIELENSLLSDHELRDLSDRTKADKANQGEDDELDTAMIQTAQDFEDSSLDELNKFTAASRLTTADIDNDCSSIQRKLDQYLILCMRQKVGSADKWMLPQTFWKDGETMRQTAERITKEFCGEEFNAKVIGNAPIAFYKYKYPKAVQASRSRIGAKIFFFKAKYQTGDIQLTDKELYRWWTYSEIMENFPTDYLKCIQSFLIDDSDVVDDQQRIQQQN